MTKINRVYEWLDRDVLLRQYSKVAKRWEDKGRNIYTLSSAVGIPSFPLRFLAGNLGGIIEPHSVRVVNEILNGFIHASDGYYNLDGLRGRVEESTDSNSKVIDRNILSRKLNRITRVPYFLSSVGLLGKVAYDAYNYLANGEPMPNEDFHLASLGLSNIGLASSMYLKDRDPKLLDRQPAWKRALESAKEKAGELSDRVREGVQDWVPRPQPELMPIPFRYETLEEYID